MARFKPTLRASLIALLLFAVLIGLGTWQLQRREWKTALIAEFDARVHAPEAELPARLDDPAQWNFRHVRLTGRFDPTREVLLLNRMLDDEPGLHVLTPFIRSDGPTVLVDRGWVPVGTKQGAFPPQQGEAELHGVARVPEPQGSFVPPNDPAHGQWFWIDIPAIAGAGAAPVVVELLPGSDRKQLPIGVGGTQRANLRNEHLNYAIFWYSMAAVLVVIFVLSSRRRSPDA